MKKYRWILIDFILVSLIISYAVSIVIFAEWNWKWICIYFITSYILNTIFIIFSIANNDNQTEKLSWIFFSCVIPYVGIVYYILFRVRRKKGKKINEFENDFKPFLINQYKTIENVINDENIKIKTWISKLVKRNFYKSNIKVFKYGIEAFESLINEMKNAKKYIFIEMYILKHSEIYEKLKEVLIQKVKEGVDVRIILDKFGTWKVPIDELKYLKYEGIKIAFFNTPYYPYVRHTDNKRLHRKFYIIDGKSVYFGGLNISDEYCSLNKKYGFWADLNFFANGMIINDYQSVFIYDWYQITKEKISIETLNIAKDAKEKDLILTFEDGPTKVTNYLEDTIDYLINSSQKSIKIATPYLIPSEKIFNSLKNALQRNVEIEIYIPGLPDKIFTYQATLFYASLLTEYGAKIYKLNNIFLHSKYAVFDNEFAYIGTNNLDMRSFYTNQESINIVFGNSIINELNKTFDDYKLISIENNKKLSKIGKGIKAFIFKLCSPLM